MIKENKYFKIVEEKSPHIAKKIAFLWGEPEFNQVMNNLMNDSRNGSRQGFNAEVSTALFELMLEHDKQFPDFGPSQPGDIFKY